LPQRAELRRIGVVGLSVIGGGVVAALDRAGRYEVIGYDIDPQKSARAAKQARIADSLRAVGEASELVFVAVFDDEQVRQVLAGEDSVLAGERRPEVVVILSTVLVPTIRWAREYAAARGVAIVDCGVGGGRTAQNTGPVLMVGGDDETVARIRPVLDDCGSPVIHMGQAGAGMAAKLARNMMVYGPWYIGWEAAKLALSAGVDLQNLLDASDAHEIGTGRTHGLLKQGIGVGPIGDGGARARRLARFAHKDLQAALAQARELGLDLPVTEMIEQRFGLAVGLPFPDPDEDGGARPAETI
jgi:3-hydroxyisobutyrate dehydrogenase-like beta-hydroxyacid dehydrogenase